MKEIHDQEISLEEASARIGEDIPPRLWEFLVRRLDYREIRIDPEKGTIRFPGFIPFDQIFREALDEVKRGDVDARPCKACSMYRDVNEEEGIFARPDALEEFICEDCAKKMSAWDFFHDHLTR